MNSFLLEHLQLEVTNNQTLLDEFSSLFEEHHLIKDSYFLKENRPIEQLGIVIEGVMRIFTLDESGNETNLIFVTPGHSISGNFLPFGISSVNIQCITDVKIIVAKTDKLTELLEEYEILKPFLFKTINGAHQHILNRLTQYIKMDARERYLFFLKEYPGLVNIIPHYHIANYLGITPTQLSRIRNSISKK